ncbi:putative head completion adaptor [Vibrio phage 424E50-1]|nr:putative head completion adaptor [Vibrio phage 424E50-1]
MAAFPSANPPEVQEHIDYARFWLGNITETVITDVDMTFLIAMNMGKYGTNNCKIAYYSMLDILRWLIREGSKGSAGQAGTGEVSKIKEKVGKREKEVHYATGTSSGTSSGYDKILEDLLSSPTTIGCNPIDVPTGDSSSGGSVLIGGTGKDKNEPASPWRQSLYKTRKTWPNPYE